jgi:nicotinate-nucleotide adenylyltransferase
MSSADCVKWNLDSLRREALKLLKPKRVAHVLGVEEAAVRLARRYGEDEDLAAAAAMLHDCTKRLDKDEQLKLCRDYAIPVDSGELKSPQLLHAKTGAAVARAVFGECEQVVSAIEWHTTGRANMTVLEKILYLADYMEPNRRFTGVDTLRELVWKDLDAGMELGLRMSLESLAQRGLGVDENSMAAWQFYSNERSKQI